METETVIVDESREGMKIKPWERLNTMLPTSSTAARISTTALCFSAHFTLLR